MATPIEDLRANYGKISFGEKAHLGWAIVKTLTAVFVEAIRAPFRGSTGAPLLAKCLRNAGVSTLLGTVSKRQLHSVAPWSDEAYLAYCKQANITPYSTELSDGAKGHWFGPRSATYIIQFAHGGCFELACAPGHFQWAHDLQKTLGENVAVVVLAYIITPFAVYPTQIRENVELLRTLIEKEGKKAENIILAGDSAGASIALSTVSHILHPHPSIPTLPAILTEKPLRGLLLISPWVDFSLDHPAIKSNRRTDFLNPRRLAEAARDYTAGPEGPDSYSEPARAPLTWWKGMEGAVSDILIWGGGGELFIDSIRTLRSSLANSHPRVQYLEVPRAAHEDLIQDVGLVPRQEYQDGVDEWCKARISV